MPDALSRPQKVTDGDGQLTTYTFDPLDRITQILYAGTTTCNTASTCIKYTYDADGNLTQRVDNTGTTKFYYDALNRLTTKTLPQSGTGCPGASPAGLTYGYDGASNLTSYCDSGGQVGYGFDPANNLTSLAEPTGSCVAPLSLCTTFSYDKDNRRTETVFPGGAQFNAGYDNAGNQTSAVGKDANGGILTRFTYTYNIGTRDTAVRQTMSEADPQGNVTTSYSYDAFNRLTQAVNSSATLDYAYDASGNLCSTGSTCDGSYAYNNADELTASPQASSYSYDGNGNETGNSAGASFSYNAKNQTTAVTDNGTTLSSLSYADSGQTERTAAGGTSYGNGPSGVQIATSGGSSTYYTRDDHGNLIGERLPNGDHWYYLFDALGSVVGVTGSTGMALGNRYHYDPYGKVTLATGVVNNPWGFASGYTDSTGLVKFGARYYDPALARWTQRDTFAGGIGDPAAINRYAYVGDDPTDTTDLNGRYWSYGQYVYSYGATIGNGVLLGLVTGGVLAIVGLGFGGAVGLGALLFGSTIDIGGTLAVYGFAVGFASGFVAGVWNGLQSL